ncbi:metalloregulator ArsR/SmtB family transcription factor [Acuticoccus kandeliae]|uniref:ArsR/SmtB family transcription factor n=1 Tax=Acuticoccus kandeliae TaxID=2073160 RepID=UPI0031836BE1
MAAAAELLRLLANPNRLAILRRLADGEASVGEIERTLGIRQPTLSQQIGELRKAGLVADRRQGKAMVYRLVDPRAAALIDHLFARDPAPAGGKGTRPAKPAPAHAAVFARVLDPHQQERDATPR